MAISKRDLAAKWQAKAEEFAKLEDLYFARINEKDRDPEDAIRLSGRYRLMKELATEASSDFSKL